MMERPFPTKEVFIEIFASRPVLPLANCGIAGEADRVKAAFLGHLCIS